MTSHHLVLFALAVGGAMLLSGCTAPSNGDDEGELVEMQNLRFEPQEITIEAGTEVTWINRDSIQHNVVAANESFDGMAEDDLLNGGQTFSFTFDEPGTYPYYCAPHSSQADDGTWQGMVGTVIVTEASGNETA